MAHGQQQPQQHQLQSTATSNKIISLPLIPHHEQQRRRQREEDFLYGNSHQQQNNKHTSDSSQIPPSRGRRRVTTETLSSSLTSSSSSAQIIDALYQGLGTHYIDLWCGAPIPQRQTVIVDTGSGVTAFPCLGCQKCGDDGYHTDHLYNQSASTMFQPLSCDGCFKGKCHKGRKECQISMTYQEGSSWSAYEATDLCYAGGPHDHPLTTSSSSSSTTNDNINTMQDTDPRLASSFAFPMTFGCQTHLTGMFKTQLADGIMGMDNAETSFWFQMHQAGKIQQRMFSLCYSRPPIPVEREGTLAGAMTLGGSDPRLHITPMVYAAMMTRGDTTGWYSVKIRHVYLATTSTKKTVADGNNHTNSNHIQMLNVTDSQWNYGRTTIVDSGTTSTYISSITLEFWNVVWQQVTGFAYFDTDTPVHMTLDELNQLPTIFLQLYGDERVNAELLPDDSPTFSNGIFQTGLAGDLDPMHPYDVLLAIPPSHYMEYLSRNDQYLASFVIEQTVSGNVLGANVMMGHDVLFDVENSRVGFANSHCDYAQLLESTLVPPATAAPSKYGQENDDEEERDPIKKCDAFACRGSIVAGLVVALFLGLCVGRAMGRVKSQQGYQLTTTTTTISELEMSVTSKTKTMGGFVQYRDDPTPAAGNGIMHNDASTIS